MDTGKPRKKVTEDEVEVRTRFDSTDIIVKNNNMYIFYT